MIYSVRRAGSEEAGLVEPIGVDLDQVLRQFGCLQCFVQGLVSRFWHQKGTHTMKHTHPKAKLEIHKRGWFLKVIGSLRSTI